VKRNQTVRVVPLSLIELAMKTLSDLIALFRSSQASKDSVIAAKDQIIAAKDAEIERLKSEDATEDAAYEGTIAELNQRVATLEEKAAADQAAIDAAYDEFDGDAPVEEAPVEETPVEETPVEETPVDETPVEEAPTF
jgi:uncharacterized coiled-coil protein SlyX